MRLNKYLASTLFTGLFITATILTPPAMGQEQSLQPQGAWAITKIDRSAQGGKSYCTLSRKYDDGVVLSLGRNQTEEYSLAIDFQKQTFEKGKSLKINLQPGPGQIRAYDMMPASEKAVVVRLGWDTGFFDALNKSQQMKVKIADKNYAFAMPEVTKGQADLQECMEGLQTAAKNAKGESTASAPTKDVLNADPIGSKEFDAGKRDGKMASANAMPSAAPVASAPDNAAQKDGVAAPEKSLLQRFADDVRSEKPRTNDDEPRRQNFNKQNNSETVAANDTAKSKAPLPPSAAPELVVRPAPSAPVTASAAQMAAVSPAAAFAQDEAKQKALQKQIDDLKMQNKSLQQKSTAPSAETQKQLAQLQQAQQKAEAEKAALQQKLAADVQAAQQKADAEKAAMQQKLTADAQAAQAAQQKAEAEKVALQQKMAADVQAAQQQANAEKAALQQKLMADAQAAKQKAEAEKAAFEKAEAEKLALQQKLDAALQSQSKLPKPEEVAASQAKVSELQAKNAQLEDSLRQAQVRIGETAINTESKSMKRITDLESKLEAAMGDNKNLAQQLESARLRQEDKTLTTVAGDWDLEKATKRFNEAEREIRRLGLQLEQERTSCNREKAQIEQMLFDPAVADQKQIQRLSQLEQELEAAKSKSADPATIQKQVNDQVAILSAQKAQALEAEKANTAALQKSLAERDAKLASLQQATTASQTAVADKAKIAQELADLKKIMLSNDIAMRQKEQELAALKAVPKTDPAQVTALQAQLKSMSDAIALKDKAVAEAQAAAKAAQAAQTAALAEAAKPKADPATQAQLASLHTQNKTMADTLAAKDKALADAQAMAKTAQAAAAQPKTDPAVLKQIADLQTSMTSIKADNDVLRDQNTILRQESDKLKLQIADAASSGGARADQLASLQLQIDTMKRQAATKDTQIATYQNQLASTQQESSQLKTRLSAADSTRSSSNEEVGALTRQIQQLQKQVTDMQADKRNDRSAMADSYAGITPAAGYVSGTPARVEAQPVSMTSGAGASMAGYDKNSIQSLLQKSGLNVNGVSKSSSGLSGADNFSWTDSANVRGLASVKMAGGAGFDAMVEQYITYQKGQCSGDFASMPSPANGSGAKKMALYEVACVGSGGQSQSASLVFFEDQGRFIAIANQIDAANMDIAMDSRDKIAGFVKGL